MAFAVRRYDRNMKRILFALPTLVLASTLLAAPLSAAQQPQVFTITASATTLFTPNAITVHAGQPVELKLVGQSGVHGIASSQLGIPATTITPGSTHTVTFTPTKPGTYTLHCTIPCGPQHADMVIKVKVV